MGEQTASRIAEFADRHRPHPPPMRQQAEPGDPTVHACPDAFHRVFGAPFENLQEQWQMLLSRHLQLATCGGCIAAALPAASVWFDARARSGTLGSMHYCHLEADAHVLRIHDSAPLGSGQQIIVLQLSGSSSFHFCGQNESLGPSEILLISHSNELVIEQHGRVGQLLLVPELDDAMSAPPPGLRRLAADGPLARLAFRWMRDGCFSAGAIPNSLARRVSTALSRLLAHAWMAQAPCPVERAGSIDFRTIENYVQHRLADPCLSPGSIANALECSVRTLHRAFHRAGLPPIQRYLWQMRVQASAETLRGPAAAASTLTEIAFAFGFSSSAHFSTLFRETFGLTPSEFRKRSQAKKSTVVGCVPSRAIPVAARVRK